MGRSEPLEAFASDADGVADRGPVGAGKIQKVLTRIHNDTARLWITDLGGDLRAVRLRDQRHVGAPVLDAVIHGSSVEVIRLGGNWPASAPCRDR